jgi:hypothetical protein
MLQPIQLIFGIALALLLMSGCDAQKDAEPAECRGANGQQLQKSGATDSEGCVLGHGNTQSTDRKW